MAQHGRPKTPKAKKHSGGVCVLVKHNIVKGVHVISTPSKSNDLIWVRLSKSYFNWEDDIYLAVVYSSPENSSYTLRKNPEIFDILETDIASFSQKGKVIIAGDMNARTGTDPDYIVDEMSNYLPVPPEYVQDKPCRPRNSQDKMQRCNSYGRSLLELCKTTGLRILNGRVVGDSFG